jgi:hypothetical protein
MAVEGQEAEDARLTAVSEVQVCLAVGVTESCAPCISRRGPHGRRGVFINRFIYSRDCWSVIRACGTWRGGEQEDVISR